MYDFTAPEIKKIIKDMPGEYYYYAREILKEIDSIESDKKMIPSILFYIGTVVGTQVNK